MPKPNKQYTYTNNQQIDKDMKIAYEWVSRLEYTETNPDGVRVAKYKGEIVLLKSGGNYYVEVAINAGATLWLGFQLSNIP
ncbi:hypothetical protein CCP1ISM_50005 [Azospirillaceae bacterium]